MFSCRHILSLKDKINWNAFPDCAKSLQSWQTLCDSMDHMPQAPLSMGFSRQAYWSGSSCSPPGDLRNPGIELGLLQPDGLNLAVGSPWGRKGVEHNLAAKQQQPFYK